MEIAQRFGAVPRLDENSLTWTFSYNEGGVQHEVWFGDATSVSRRIKVARVRGLGLGFWRLGREDQRIWDDPQIAPGTVWP
jgi:spore germination protein YaaH